MNKLVVTAVACIGLVTLRAENVWRYWTAGDGTPGGDGVWSADSLTWSTGGGGGGTQVNQYKDKLQFAGDGGTVTVSGTVDIHGQIYFLSDGYTFGGDGTIKVYNGFQPVVYPLTSTTIDCPVDFGTGTLKLGMASTTNNVAVDSASAFEDARLTINSDMTFNERVILYNGTFIMNGDVTVNGSKTIGTYSAASDYHVHLQVNGTQSGCGGYTIGASAILSGTGTINLPTENIEVKIYGRMKPGGYDAPGTLTVNAGKVRFYAGAKLQCRVDLDADKADKLVCGDNCWLISDTDQGATIEIRVAGRTSETRTYQLYEFASGRKKNSFLYSIEKASSCSANVTFDEATGLLTVKPSLGMIVTIR